jgi:CheY-like chemotaxis protein
LNHSPASRTRRILFVEDDPDIRETLTELLRDEGHEVTEAETAEAGIALLEQGRFDVMLSDYNLPGKDGGWLIEEARQRGWLAQMVPLMLTASTHLEPGTDVRILRKPIDIDDLCREIEAVSARRSDPPSVPRPEHELELMLFVHGGAPSAARSSRTLEDVLQSYGLPASCLRIVDVATPEGVELAEREHISFTPTLLRLSPRPPRWIVGDLRQPSIVRRLLKDSGVKKR